MNKPSPTDLFIEHHGVKGMKWGVRRGKKSTGMGRFNSAHMEKNEKRIARNTKTINATGVKKLARVGPPMVLGTKRVNRILEKSNTKLSEQNARIKAGNQKISDRLAGTFKVSMLNLAVQRKPKD